MEDDITHARFARFLRWGFGRALWWGVPLFALSLAASGGSLLWSVAFAGFGVVALATALVEARPTARATWRVGLEVSGIALLLTVAWRLNLNYLQGTLSGGPALGIDRVGQALQQVSALDEAAMIVAAFVGLASAWGGAAVFRIRRAVGDSWAALVLAASAGGVLAIPFLAFGAWHRIHPFMVSDLVASGVQLATFIACAGGLLVLGLDGMLGRLVQRPEPQAPTRPPRRLSGKVALASVGLLLLLPGGWWCGQGVLLAREAHARGVYIEPGLWGPRAYGGLDRGGFSPPPDLDVEAFRESFDEVRERSVFLFHFPVPAFFRTLGLRIGYLML